MTDRAWPIPVLNLMQDFDGNLRSLDQVLKEVFIILMPMKVSIAKY